MNQIMNNLIIKRKKTKIQQKNYNKINNKQIF